MRTITFLFAFTLFASSTSFAQINNTKTEKIKVYGNCGMCETTIEKAGTKKKAFKTDWNEDTQMATITYDSTATNLDAILKNIALAGYDNPKFLAPDDVYNKLHHCCKYERELKNEAPKEDGHKHETKEGHDHMNHNMEQKMMPDTTAKMHDHKSHGEMKKEMPQANQLSGIFENYFSLKDGLVKTDGTVASAKATSMLTAINAVKMESLKPEVHTVWMKVKKDLEFNAEHIAETKDAGHQRDYFDELSNAMIQLAKVAGMEETIYLQHCPMANDGKGANWLSKEQAVKNPYYGNKMLTCGRVVEAIKK